MNARRPQIIHSLLKTATGHGRRQERAANCGVKLSSPWWAFVAPALMFTYRRDQGTVPHSAADHAATSPAALRTVCATARKFPSHSVSFAFGSDRPTPTNRCTQYATRGAQPTVGSDEAKAIYPGVVWPEPILERCVCDRHGSKALFVGLYGCRGWILRVLERDFCGNQVRAVVFGG
jgi:hypothetical protein